ncbi:PE family protein [Mycobacterium kansasii]|uniref:PE family protein n=1 Tax=Mycobacterium kansasii TaxID=1768 RepID=A0A1V3XY73_MYCKA|nr:PE family protein [Mycobacterium kansasii]
MSFLTTQPDELAAAAGKLQTIGATMEAENVAAAVPTTGVIPAAADEVSMLQASMFTAYGSLYQQISAEAAAMYEMLVNTLGVSAGTYAAAEAANSSAAASPLSDILGRCCPARLPDGSRISPISSTSGPATGRRPRRTCWRWAAVRFCRLPRRPPKPTPPKPWAAPPAWHRRLRPRPRSAGRRWPPA